MNAFVLGLFTAIFAGMPWYVMVCDDPVLPWWLRIAIFCLLGGILAVLATLALEQRKNKAPIESSLQIDTDAGVLLLAVPLNYWFTAPPSSSASRVPCSHIIECF